MFPAGRQQYVCDGTGGGDVHPPGAPLESETLRGQGSTCWDSLLGSQKCEDGVENQETVRIHNQGAWLNGHMGAAKEERERNC